jgi:hypothetical protein
MTSYYYRGKKHTKKNTAWRSIKRVARRFEVTDLPLSVGFSTVHVSHFPLAYQPVRFHIWFNLVHPYPHKLFPLRDPELGASECRRND